MYVTQVSAALSVYVFMMFAIEIEEGVLDSGCDGHRSQAEDTPDIQDEEVRRATMPASTLLLAGPGEVGVNPARGPQGSHGPPHIQLSSWSRDLTGGCDSITHPY